MQTAQRLCVEQVEGDKPMQRKAVEFSAEGGLASKTIRGELLISPSSRAAVVIAPDASGFDSRGVAYARALAEAGVSSLEVGAPPARGMDDALAQVFGAFRFLTSWPQIDALRIGVMGFARGGVLAMLTATRAVARRYLRNGERFAAHAPLYPLLWRYNNVDGFEFRDLTGAPIFLQCGSDDDYDPPGALDALLARLDRFDHDSIRPRVYAGARHGFDRLDAAEASFADALAHGGRGGEVRVGPDRQSARAALQATADFFQETLTRG